jgi:hypothetical protein
MEKLSLMQPKEMPYDIIYDIKKARIWHLKMPKVIRILLIIYKRYFDHFWPLSAPLRAAEGSVRPFVAPSQFSFCQPPGHSFSHEREKGRRRRVEEGERWRSSV